MSTDRLPLVDVNKEEDENYSPQNDYGTRVVPSESQNDTRSSQQMTNFVLLLTCMSAIGGFLFGYDTGVVSGAMLLLREDFHLSSVWQESIISITIGMAAVGAFLGGPLNDCFGRKPVILASSLFFTFGAFLLGLSNGRVMLLIGRAILGVAIGFASMTVPIYIAECSPSDIRGRMVVVYQVLITFGMLVAAIVDGLFSYDRQNGWRYMLGLAGVPSLIQFIGFIFMPESPRWLVGKQREIEARQILCKIRGNEDVEEEMKQIQSVAEEEKQMIESHGGTPLLVQALTTPPVRRAIFVGCMLQCFQQISGINTVMYYSATIIKLSGVRDESTAIWLASITAATNFIFSFVGLWLVERIGRKPLIIGSIAGVTVSLAVLGLGFQLAAYNSPPVTLTEDAISNVTSSQCAAYRSCDACMTDLECGYCFNPSPDGAQNGSCLPVAVDDNTGDKLTEQALYGRCQNQTSLNVWAYDFCPTDVAWITTFGLVLYLMCFSPGLGPMPWTINSEIYPLWARSVGNSLSTFTNWTFNLLISMTFLTLTEVLTRYGAFYLYMCFSLLGCIFMYIFLPETKGKTLEEVEKLFTVKS